jgi:hypothetical protein
MEEKQQRELFWDARVVISFKANKMKLHILVFESTKEKAENRAIEWAKQYVEDHSKAISKDIGNTDMYGDPRVQVLKTSYAAVI